MRGNKTAPWNTLFRITGSDSKVSEFQSEGNLRELPTSSWKEGGPSCWCQVLTLLLALSHGSLVLLLSPPWTFSLWGLKWLLFSSAVVSFEWLYSRSSLSPCPTPWSSCLSFLLRALLSSGWTFTTLVVTSKSPLLVLPFCFPVFHGISLVVGQAHHLPFFCCNMSVVDSPIYLLPGTLSWTCISSSFWDFPYV